MRRVYVQQAQDEVPQGLGLAQRQRMIARHQESLKLFGRGVESLFWASRGEQKERFRVLAAIGIQAGDSLLDVGCGFGDLYGWLKSHGLDVQYTGIDLSPDVLACGREMNPELALLQGEIFDFDWRERHFDWLVLSGTLNWDIGENEAYACRTIGRMFALCRKGVAFNMLDKRNLNAQQLGELTGYDPQEMLAYCRQLTPNCQLRSDYIDADFTIHMRRD